jgi:hypothetical protein
MLVTLSSFALGLFVGGYALASFAPVALARTIYRNNWAFWGLFLVLAYLEKTSGRPMTLSGATAPHIPTLIAVVISGIAVSFVGGMLWARRVAAQLEVAQERV